jgi:surface antigen
MARVNRRAGLRLAAAAAAVGFLMTGCNKDLGNQLGQVAGNVGGSYLSQTGIPGTQSIGDLTTNIGGLIGEEIAKYLDERERVQAEAAAREAINSNKVGPDSTRTWSSQSNTGVSGGSTVIARNNGSDGRECRTQRNFVNVKGKDVEQTETLCRDPKTGTWSAGAV